jgi:hypothetical protein
MEEEGCTGACDQTRYWLDQDIVTEVKNSLPDDAILFYGHGYLSVCSRAGGRSLTISVLPSQVLIQEKSLGLGELGACCVGDEHRAQFSSSLLIPLADPNFVTKFVDIAKRFLQKHK